MKYYMSTAQKVALLFSAIALAIILVGIGGMIYKAFQSEPLLTTKEEAQAITLLSRSTPSTVTIGMNDRNTVSDFWYGSGAKEAGFDLDAYKLAVESLNPGVDLDPVWEGEELRFPMNIK